MERILETERETLKLRLLAVAAAVAGLYLRQREVALLPALALAASYLIYALLLRTVIIPRVRSQYLVYIMMLIDAAALTSALHLAGGIQSSIFILFPLFIIYYAIYFAYVSSLAAATIVTFAFVGYAYLTGQARASDSFLAFQIPLFYLLAVFSGYLARKELEEREKKEALQEFIRIESGAKGLMEVARTINRTLELYEEWASRYASRGAYKEAVERLQFSLNIDAQYALTHYLFARVYAETGQVKNASEAFRRATELDPHLYEAYKGLAETLVRQGLYAEALAPAQRYADMMGQDWVGHQTLAVIYHELGMEDKSQSEAERAIALSPAEDREAVQSFFQRLLPQSSA